MLRTFLILLFCLTSMSAHAGCNGSDIRLRLTASQRATLQREVDKVPFNQGNHWIATRGNQTIHVVGTLNFNDGRMNKIMRNLKPVVAQANAILFEVTEHETKQFWKTIKVHKSLFLLPEGSNVQEMISDNDWQTIVAAAKRRGWDINEIAKFKPWVLSSQLTGSTCGPQGSFARNGLSTRIEKQARRKCIPIGSLETMESAIKTLNKQSLNDQITQLQFDLLENNGVDDGLITIREAYFDETVTEAMILNEWNFSRRLPGSKAHRTRIWQRQQNAIGGQRNKSGMPIIQRTKGDLLMVVVGAGNLPGRDGILNLLRKAGYKMQRAEF